MSNELKWLSDLRMQFELAAKEPMSEIIIDAKLGVLLCDRLDELGAARVAALESRLAELEAEVERLRGETAAWTSGKAVLVPCDKLKEMQTQLAEAWEALEWCANEIARINIKIHGDLHGCDCEGGCSCKPELWCELEAVKYHCLGAALAKLEGGRDE